MATDGLTKELEKLTASLAAVAKETENVKQKEAVLKNKTKEVLAQTEGLEGRIDARGNNEKDFGKSLEHGAGVQAEGKLKLEKVEKDIAEAEKKLREVEEELLSAEIAVREVKAKGCKEANSKRAREHTDMAKTKAKLLTERKRQLNGVTDVVDSLTKGKDALEACLKTVHYYRLKKIQTDAEEAEDVLEEQKNHAAALDEANEKELKTRDTIKEAAAQLSSLTKTYSKLLEGEAEIARFEAEAAEVERQWAGDTIKQQKMIREYTENISVVKAHAAAECEGQSEAFKAVLEAEVEAVDQNIEKLAATRDMLQIKMELASQEANLAKDQQVASSKCSAVTNKRLTKILDICSSLQSLYDKQRELQETLEATTAALATTKAETKRFSAKLIIADPNAGHTIPVTPKSSRKTRNTSTVESAKKKARR
eukprot:TRINITY_DN16968_c0_g1_i1.p1 TRINITY_DN16968_c0_g1~~TRINITY_DN16968_c0_g1_i1.p1  ORF type:complete len:443 (+),score=155.76 TRINITY_DN16968_c0_g1_i1:55-1329(+)